jgi:hypothetical protein
MPKLPPSNNCKTTLLMNLSLNLLEKKDDRANKALCRSSDDILGDFNVIVAIT